MPQTSLEYFRVLPMLTFNILRNIFLINFFNYYIVIVIQIVKEDFDFGKSYGVQNDLLC